MAKKNKQLGGVKSFAIFALIP
ncbi:MAG: hypothetical protein RL566_209, partial [Actinomycetota bacterium]